MFPRYSSSRGELTYDLDSGYVDNLPMDYNSSLYDSNEYSYSTWPYKYHLRATTVSETFRKRWLCNPCILIMLYLIVLEVPPKFVADGIRKYFLTLSTLGKSRRQFEIYFLFFPEKRL